MMVLQTVPNQNTVTVHRETLNNNYIAINKTSFANAYKAMSNSSSALALYIWLVGNKDGYKFAFSPQAIQNQLGMARSSCHGAVRKLMDLGYLVQRSSDSNAFDFYEVAPNGEKPVLDFSDGDSPPLPEEEQEKPKEKSFVF